MKRWAAAVFEQPWAMAMLTLLDMARSLPIWRASGLEEALLVHCLGRVPWHCRAGNIHAGGQLVTLQGGRGRAGAPDRPGVAQRGSRGCCSRSSPNLIHASGPEDSGTTSVRDRLITRARRVAWTGTNWPSITVQCAARATTGLCACLLRGPGSRGLAQPMGARLQCPHTARAAVITMKLGPRWRASGSGSGRGRRGALVVAALRVQRRCWRPPFWQRARAVLPGAGGEAAPMTHGRLVTAGGGQGSGQGSGQGGQRGIAVSVRSLRAAGSRTGGGGAGTEWQGSGSSAPRAPRAGCIWVYS